VYVPEHENDKSSSTNKKERTLLAITKAHQKRLSLVLYFAQYMKTNLVSSCRNREAGAQTAVINSDESKTENRRTTDGGGNEIKNMSPNTSSSGHTRVFLQKWYRDETSILLCLSDGTLQVSRRGFICLSVV